MLVFNCFVFLSFIFSFFRFVDIYFLFLVFFFCHVRFPVPPPPVFFLFVFRGAAHKDAEHETCPPPPGIDLLPVCPNIPKRTLNKVHLKSIKHGPAYSCRYRHHIYICDFLLVRAIEIYVTQNPTMVFRWGRNV